MEFDPASVEERFGSPVVLSMEISIGQTLVAAFGENTPDFKLYVSASNLDHGPMNIGVVGDPITGGFAEPFQGYLHDGRNRAISLLNQAIGRLEKELSDGSLDNKA